MDTFNLKPMSKDAVPAALAKAERYRLLNEPGEAESICLDILQVDPQNEDAAVLVGEAPVGGGGESVADVQRSRRARREPDADAHASIGT